MFDDDLSLQPKTAHERSGGNPHVETDTPPLDHTAREEKELTTLSPYGGGYAACIQDCLVHWSGVFVVMTKPLGQLQHRADRLRDVPGLHAGSYLWSASLQHWPHFFAAVTAAS